VANRRPLRRNAYPVAVRLLLLTLLVAALAWVALGLTMRASGSRSFWNWAGSGGLGSHPGLWALAQASIGSVVVVASALLLAWRVNAARHERDVWRWLTLAVAALSVGFVGQAVLIAVKTANLASVGAWQSLPLSICALLACLAIYQGLVRWNRFRTVIAEPADWLNGLGSVLVATALGNLIIRWTGSPLGQWPWWQLQGWLLRVAAVVVLLGAAATVVFMGGLTRDRRAWVICFALAVILGCEILSVSKAGSSISFGGLSQLGWTLGAAAIACCAVWRPAEVSPRASTTQASTVGALVVMIVSVGVLALDSEFPEHGSRLPILYAVLAFLSAATRAIHIMRALSQLARTRLEARSDELTGIANRRELVARLGDLVSARSAVGVLVIDLDRFKNVNDRFGHAVGDELLRVTSGRLQTRLPRNALLARLGGDEFAVLLEDASIEEATSIAKVLAEALSATIEIDGHLMSVGASIGVAVLPSAIDVPEDDEGEELLRRADVAMYLAKRSGGGVSVYDLAVDVAAQRQSRRVDELREVLTTDSLPARRQLVVHYQPQVSLRTGEVVGAEALVRWQHPQLGLVGPAAFLDLVEAHDLMGELTARVLEEASAQAVRWHAMGHPLRVSVNLSSSSLTSPELLPLIDRILRTTPLDPAELTLEITETSVIVDSELALQTTREIAARGIAVSIDDYGTGYSCLSYLNDLPATELKLDRSFTARVVTDQRTAVIVSGTIELAHRLGLRIIAEGVEDQAALDVLRSLDCDEVQGYHCGRPMPVEDFNAWLAAHDRDDLAGDARMGVFYDTQAAIASMSSTVANGAGAGLAM
jgi:diguanylate cyclase (GGDEF)-like protein